MRRRIVLLILGMLLAGVVVAQSGLDPGAKVPPLVVYDATGEHRGEEVDYARLRGEKPTLYLFVRELDRPQARFIRLLDERIADHDASGVYCVAVFMHHDEVQAIKDHLPRIQQSVKFRATVLTANPGAREQPNGWGLDPKQFVTAIVANKGAAVQSFPFVSVNESDAPKVIAALEKTLPPAR